jgi:hypothetical protein
MDGLTAARAIRAIERERGAAAIPIIIAFTANALLQDIELSRKTGCNRHLSKPIARHKLLSAIEEYGPTTTSVVALETGPARVIRIERPSGLEEIVPGARFSNKSLPETAAGHVGIVLATAVLSASVYVCYGYAPKLIQGSLAFHTTQSRSPASTAWSNLVRAGRSMLAPVKPPSS